MEKYHGLAYRVFREQEAHFSASMEAKVLVEMSSSVGGEIEERFTISITSVWGSFVR